MIIMDINEDNGKYLQDSLLVTYPWLLVLMGVG